jgi:hypothetical protein
MAALNAGCMTQHNIIAARPRAMRASYRSGVVMSMRSGGGSSQSEQLPTREGDNFVPKQEATQPKQHSQQPLGDVSAVSTQGGSPSPPDAQVETVRHFLSTVLETQRRNIWSAWHAQEGMQIAV